MSNRLEGLIGKKYLTERLFSKISENMHFEILKYLDWKDLLVLREVKSGGFQIISNRKLRKPIGNFMNIILSPNLEYKRLAIETRRISLLFVQINMRILKFDDFNVNRDQLDYLCQLCMNLNEIDEFQISNYLYISCGV